MLITIKILSLIHQYRFYINITFTFIKFIINNISI